MVLEDVHVDAGSFSLFKSFRNEVLHVFTANDDACINESGQDKEDQAA